MKTYLLPLLALAALLPSLALADWAKIPSKDFPLNPPPSIGSKTYKNDFATLHRYQETRTEEDCALSRSQKYPDFHSLFGRWDGLSQEEKHLAEPLTEKAMKLAERVADYHKGKFKRPRPYSTDPSIEPCVDMPTGAKSYPSSHAASAAMGACVLAKFFPEKEASILEYGAFLGELRAIVGVHHPSDVKAGQKLAQDICDQISEDPSFQEELP